ncbi:hypothetical protein Pmani_017038 [Petrolisthes manimaculis]|uniref:Uncharacterized protein n=1 Tax=Petrolisthes manimaculis TaxID=1843537 RepID=A0AAE1PQD4_9EUCA|nr:hypothetical protein Pmani_017038 [Petrolisthes manimaculis]
MTSKTGQLSFSNVQLTNISYIRSAAFTLQILSPVCASASYSKCHLTFEMAKGGDESLVVLDETSVPLTPESDTIPTYKQKRKQSGLWREAQATCRVLVLDIYDDNILAGIRLLEWAALWTQPDTWLVGIGKSDHVTTALLLHPGLRNTRYAFYVTKQIHRKYNTKKEGTGVEVWRRCGYCEGGQAGVERLGTWNETTPGIPQHPSLFRDRPENYNRHKFRLFEKELFPYISSERLSDEPGALIRHRDAIGTRVIQAMSSSLNFTKGLWGNENDKLTSKNVKLTSKNDKLTSKNDKLTSKNDKLTSKNDKLTSKNDKLTSKNDKLTSKNDKLTSKNDKLTSKNDKLTSKNDKLTSKNDKLTSKNDKLTSKNDKLTSKNDKLTSKNDKLTSKNDKLTSKNKHQVKY